MTLRGLALDDNPRSAWFDRYSEQRQGPEQVEKFTRSVKVGDGAVLDLSHLAGDVRVTGGTGSEIKIDATKRVRHRDADEAKRLLEALRIDVNNFNNRVEVRTIYPRRTSTRGNSISANVDYVIEVPSGIAVALKSVSGDIAVSNVRGEVRLEADQRRRQHHQHAERGDGEDGVRQCDGPRHRHADRAGVEHGERHRHRHRLEGAIARRGIGQR